MLAIDSCYHLKTSPRTEPYTPVYTFLCDPDISVQAQILYSIVYSQCLRFKRLEEKGRLDSSSFLTNEGQFYFSASAADIAEMTHISRSGANYLINELTDLGLIEKDGTVNRKSRYLVYFPVLDGNGNLEKSYISERIAELANTLRSGRKALRANRPCLNTFPLIPELLKSGLPHSALPLQAQEDKSLKPTELFVLSRFDSARRLSEKNRWETDGAVRVLRDIRRLADECALSESRTRAALSSLIEKSYILAVSDDSGLVSYFLRDLYGGGNGNKADRRPSDRLLANAPSSDAKCVKISGKCVKTDSGSVSKFENLLYKNNANFSNALGSSYPDTDDFRAEERFACAERETERKLKMLDSGKTDFRSQTKRELLDERRLYVTAPIGEDAVNGKIADSILSVMAGILSEAKDRALMRSVLRTDAETFRGMCRKLEQALYQNALNGTPVRHRTAYIRKMFENFEEIVAETCFPAEPCERESRAEEFADVAYPMEADEISRMGALGALEDAAKSAGAPREDRSVLIRNSRPAGKSFTLRWFARRMKKPLFLSCADENKLLARNRDKTISDIISALIDAPVLVLDNLGLENRDFIAKALEARLDRPDRITLAATSLTPAELNERYGARLLSRLCAGRIVE